jgi:AsmA protein
MTSDKRSIHRLIAGGFIALVAITGAATSILIETAPGSLDAPALRVAAAVPGEITVSEPVQLMTSPRLILERGTIRLDRPASLIQRKVESPEQILAGGRAALVLDGARLSLDMSPHASAEAEGTAGSSNPSQSAELSPLLTAMTRLGFAGLSIRNAVLTIKRAHSEEAIENINAEIAVNSGKSLEANATIRLTGETLTLEASLGAPQGGASARSHTLAMRLSGPSIDAKADGRLKLGPVPAIVSSKGELRVKDIRQTARWLGAPLVEGPGLASFEASGPMTWSDGRLSFEKASFVVDGNSATGGLSISLTAGRPFVEGTLAFEAFEVAPYLSVGEQGRAPFSASSMWLQGIADPNGRRTLLISEFDADLRMSASRVSASGTAIGSGAVSVTVKDRIMQAEVAELTLETGGSGDAHLTVDARQLEPRVAIRGRLMDCELATLSRLIFGFDLLSGPGQVDADLTGWGASLGTALASATGTVGLTMDKGGSIAAGLNEMIASSGDQAKAAWGSGAGPRTQVQSLTAHIEANVGHIEIRHLDTATATARFLASGTIDPVQKALAVQLQSVAQDELNASGRPAVIGSVEISGPWASPLIRKMETPGRAAGTQ